ncbi:Cupredoxin [Bisporella sp. PMI_857]|nr:Cupredoxin [Bisporella sp. PMI_857]
MSLRSLAVGLALVSSAVGANFDVTVGKGGLVFNPPNVKAAVGDTITYKFFPKNHAVVQSSFAEPCKPLAGGFFSDFVPTQDAANAARTTFTVTVKDDKPIWVYCPQTNGDHCQAGMVGSINAPDSGNTFDAFKALALKASKPSTKPNGGPVGGVRKISVDVGVGGNIFTPQNITEPIGTVVSYSFNPKNHTVTQSNFADPCVPLAGNQGFFSGFVPTTNTPSGVTFDITVKDDKPIWFYCSQGNHCSSGMVGSVNAPPQGANTLKEFIFGASKFTGAAGFPPNAPFGGNLFINGQAVTQAGGVVIDTSKAVPGAPAIPAAPPAVSNPPAAEPPVMSPLPSPPPPAATITPEMQNMAGGAQPAAYGWATSVSENATNLMQMINWVDNVLVDVMVNGHKNITQGGWKGMYPASIQNTIGSMGAQSIVHRCTSTDSLKHYNKKVVDQCKYRYPIANIQDFIKVSLTLTLLEVGLLLDTIGAIVSTDAWMVGPLASTLGSKARMAGLINMMQNHAPAAAPREVAMPAALVYSYINNKYIEPNSCPDKLPYTSYPSIPLTEGSRQNGKLTSINVNGDSSIQQPGMQMAWLGPWGKVWYEEVKDGKANVPAELSGHVWGVLVKNKVQSMSELPSVTIAGPEMVWVTQP